MSVRRYELRDAAGVLVAPLEQALNTSAITLSTPTSRKRVVTA